MAEAAPDTDPVPTSEGAAEEPASGAAAAPSIPPGALDDYGDMHRLVLQGMMASGMLDSKGVKRLFVGACSYLGLDTVEFTKMSYVQKVVREVNDRIRPYDMAIRSASCELSGKKFYIYLLTVEKPLMKFQTLFSYFEITYFQKIMDLCLRDYNNFGIPITECTNLARTVDSKIRLEAAEHFIRTMMEWRYLAKYVTSKDDFNVTLGFRGIREFEPVLRDVYPEVVANCCLCHLILLHGYICPGCRTHVHKPCYNRFDPTVKLCPKCNGSWDLEVMITRSREAEGLEFTAGPSTSKALQQQMKKLSIVTTTTGPSRATDTDAVAGPSRTSEGAGPSGASSSEDPAPMAFEQEQEPVVDLEPTTEEVEPAAPTDDQSHETHMEEAEPEENPESSEADESPAQKAAPKKRKGRRGKARRGSRR